MLAARFRCLCSRFARSRTGRARSPRSCLPSLEPLEPRIQPDAGTAVWTGLGPDANWTTGLNWQGEVAPSPGDNLVFPALDDSSSSQPPTVDDFPASRILFNTFSEGTTFQSLTLSGTGYILIGNGIALKDGIRSLSLRNGGNSVNRSHLSISLLDPLSDASGGSQGASVSTIVVEDKSELTLLQLTNEPGRAAKLGTGTLVLEGFYSFGTASSIGTVAVLEGTVRATAISGGGTIVVNKDATLEESGRRIGETRVLDGGTLRVGDGTPIPINVPSEFGVIGEKLDLQSGSRLVIDLSLGFSGRFRFETDVTTLAARLELPRLDFLTSLGQSITLLADSTSSPLPGVFEGLPEGSVFERDGREYHLTYQGGDGNDAVLTRGVPSTVTLDAGTRTSFTKNPLQLTAVLSSTLAPRGQFQFLDGQTVLGQVPVTNGQGVSVFVVSSPTAGDHAYQAKYIGEEEYLVTQSAVVAHEVRVISDSDDSRFVKQLFQDVLNRPSTTSDRSFFEAQLSAVRETTLKPLVEQLVESVEFAQSTVKAAYDLLLGRSAQDFELPFWLDFLSGTGRREEDLLALMSATPEYANTDPTANAAWLTKLYIDLLNRNPEEGGAGFWLNQLQSGRSRTAVATAILETPEYRGLRITDDYQRFLSRGPTPGDVAHWIGQINRTSRSTSAILVPIASSAESFRKNGNGYQAWYSSLYPNLMGRGATSEESTSGLNFLMGSTSRVREIVVRSILTSDEALRGRVDQIYRRVLNRSADEPGLAFWLTALRQGATLEQIEALILGSLEFFDRSGGTSEGLIQVVYQLELQRAPSAADLQFWIAFLQSGGARGEFVLQLLSSDERRASQVRDAYQTFLHRAADVAGFEFWQSRIRAGNLSLTQFQIEFITNSEYYRFAGLSQGA